MLVSASNLKRPLYFPRCLIDSTVLWMRTSLGKKKKIIKCTKCGLQYARTAIKDADPERWNRTRNRNLYQVKTDSNGRVILYHQGLGSRRIIE